ncbi:hypothetical protein QTP88_001814 [Uroleucon formosanum]
MSSIKFEKERLISLVFAENQIWNQKHDKYHNRDEKILIWTRIATNLGTTAEEAKKKWEGLRDTFRKEFKKVPKPKSGQGFTPQSSKWPYFNQLLFLKDNMTPRNTATNIPLDPMIPTLDDSDNNSELDFTDEDEHVEQNEHEDEVVGLNNIPNVQSTTPQYRKHSKRKSYQTEAIEIERKKIKLFEERLKTKKNADSDEDYHFLMSLLPSFKKMDSLKKMKVRMEVLSIITKTQNFRRRNFC